MKQNQMMLSNQRTFTLAEAADRLFGQPLMVRPMTGRVFAKRLQEADDRIVMVEQSADMLRFGGSSGPQKPYAMDNGVAVIEINGALVNRYGWMEGCGFTSYEYLRAQLEYASTDNDVKAILLRIASPGGECAGAFGLADFLYNIRSQKKVWGVTDDYAFSAGYLILSQCEKAFVTKTGGTGSVGVIAQLLDATEFDKKVGFKYTLVTAGARKADGNPHVETSAEAVDDLQAEVDRLYGMFTAAVARGRGIPEADVRATEARIFAGPRAVEIGFADGVANFHEVLAMLTAQESSAGAARMEAPPEGAQLNASDAGLADELLPTDSLPADPVEDPDEVDDGEEDVEAAVEADGELNMNENTNPVAEQQAAHAAMENHMKLAHQLCQFSGAKFEPDMAFMSMDEVKAAIKAQLAANQPEIKTTAAPKQSGATSLDAAAKQLRAASGNAMTHEQAYVSALKDSPESFYEELSPSSRKHPLVVAGFCS